MLTVKQCEFALEDLRRRKRIIGDKNEEYTDHLERLQLAYTKELGKALKRDEGFAEEVMEWWING